MINLVEKFDWKRQDNQYHLNLFTNSERVSKFKIDDRIMFFRPTKNKWNHKSKIYIVFVIYTRTENKTYTFLSHKKVMNI